MRKKCAAYFTVEAVMILPIVVWVIGLVIYMMLLQYNRCLMEQDLGMVLLRAGSFTVSSNEVAEEAATLCSGINREKYLACDVEHMSVEEQLGGLIVRGRVQVNAPTGSLGMESEAWQAERSYECLKQSPVYIIRACNKIKKSLENKE